MRVANDLLLEETEMRLLLHGIRDCYGFDFRDYDSAWVRARVWDRVNVEQIRTVSGFQERVLHDPAALEGLLRALAVSRTALFSDVQFYQAFRAVVVPILRTYPFAQIWVPACSTGEDVFSLAILLLEEGLAGRVRLYATDVSEAVFAGASDGSLPADRMSEGEGHYREAGGTASLQDYFSIEGDRAVLRLDVRSIVIFSEHNLATDDVFNEFQVIVARHILPLFHPVLQRRVHTVFSKSLSRFGVLCLDRQDGPLPPENEHGYQPLLSGMNFYRKVEPAG